MVRVQGISLDGEARGPLRAPAPLAAPPGWQVQTAANRQPRPRIHVALPLGDPPWTFGPESTTGKASDCRQEGRQHCPGTKNIKTLSGLRLKVTETCGRRGSSRMGL